MGIDGKTEKDLKELLHVLRFSLQKIRRASRRKMYKYYNKEKLHIKKLPRNRKASPPPCSGLKPPIPNKEHIHANNLPATHYPLSNIFWCAIAHPYIIPSGKNSYPFPEGSHGVDRRTLRHDFLWKAHKRLLKKPIACSVDRSPLLNPERNPKQTNMFSLHIRRGSRGDPL